MITRSKQNWTVGQTVKVGFLSLVVRAAIQTPGDGLPDVYFLSNAANTKLYQFTPHRGLEAVTIDEAASRIATFRARIEAIAARDAARAVKHAQVAARFYEVFA